MGNAAFPKRNMKIGNSLGGLPHIRPHPPTDQTEHGNEPIFGTHSHLWTNTGVIRAIFEIPPRSRDIEGGRGDLGGEKS